MKINVRLFGAFRQYGELTELSVPEKSPVSIIKTVLENTLGSQTRNLIADSVIANDETILHDDFIVCEDTTLSILPPVCGG